MGDGRDFALVLGFYVENINAYVIMTAWAIV